VRAVVSDEWIVTGEEEEDVCKGGTMMKRQMVGLAVGSVVLLNGGAAFPADQAPDTTVGRASC